MPNARVKRGETPEQARLRYNAESRAYRLRRKTEGRPLNDSRTSEQVRHHDWWKKYRMRPNDVQALWRRQECRCAVCLTPLAEPGSDRNTHIDHDHASGKVRGILCSSCNLSLGHAKDSPERLRALAGYLESQGLS